MRKGKTTDASQQELQYIKSRVTTPCGGLQEDYHQGETLIRPKPPATGLRYAPSRVGLLCATEFGTQLNKLHLETNSSCSINKSFILNTSKEKNTSGAKQPLGLIQYKPTKLDHSSNLATVTDFVNISAGLS
jgi:hypothetical protein